jgi:hypothetical protein
LQPQLPPQLPPVAPVAQAAPVKENIYTEICTEIIKEQARIISAKLAFEQIQDVPGLTVEPITFRCTVTGDGSRVINDVVTKYSTFFGHAAVEVCREAASRFLANLSPEQTPLSLR